MNKERDEKLLLNQKERVVRIATENNEIVIVSSFEKDKIEYLIKKAKSLAKEFNHKTACKNTEIR